MSHAFVTEHLLAQDMGVASAVALAPAIGQLKMLTTLSIRGKTIKAPYVLQGECPLLLLYI